MEKKQERKVEEKKERRRVKGKKLNVTKMQEEWEQQKNIHS